MTCCALSLGPLAALPDISQPWLQSFRYTDPANDGVFVAWVGIPPTSFNPPARGAITGKMLRQRQEPKHVFRIPKSLYLGVSIPAPRFPLLPPEQPAEGWIFKHSGLRIGARFHKSAAWVTVSSCKTGTFFPQACERPSIVKKASLSRPTAFQPWYLVLQQFN